MERDIDWLKQCRHLTTRFERTAFSYLDLVMFVAARYWLQNPFVVHTLVLRPRNSHA